MSAPAIDIDSLSPVERVRLIGHLWDSLPEAQLEHFGVPPGELDRRLDELDADIAADEPLGTPWADVRARIEARRGSD